MAGGAKPRIGAENHARITGVVITPTTEDTDFEAANMIDERPFNLWKGTGTSEQTVTFDLLTAKTVDYISIVEHDLKTQAATIEIHSSTDNFAASDDTELTITPTEDGEINRIITSRTRRYWRIVIPAGYTAAPSIGVFSLGESFEFDGFFKDGFDETGEDPLIRGNLSVEGEMLGRTVNGIRRVIEGRLGDFTFTWYDNTWLPFWNDFARKGKPFTLFTDITNNIDRSHWVWFDDRTRLRAPTTANFRSMRLRFIGKVRGVTV